MKICLTCTKVFPHITDQCDTCGGDLFPYNQANITPSGVNSVNFFYGAAGYLLAFCIFYLGIEASNRGALIVAGIILLISSVLIRKYIRKRKEKQPEIDRRKTEIAEAYRVYEQATRDQANKDLAIYTEKKQEANIPKESYKIVSYAINSTLFDFGETYYVWRENGQICFFKEVEIRSGEERINFERDSVQRSWPLLSPEEIREYELSLHRCIYGDIGTIRLLRFDLTSIVNFQVVGEKFVHNQISGGGGGGSSLTGALLGGLIAGDAGAIIGSRRSVDSISSSAVVKDERKVILSFLLDGKKISTAFEISALEVFEELIPQKNYDIIQAKKTKELLGEDQHSSNDTLAQIRELSKLQQEGILSAEEFEGKKQDLLRRV